MKLNARVLMIGLVAGTILIGVTVAGVMLSSGRGSGKESTLLAPTSTLLPDLQYIPIYPGAKIIETSEMWPENLRIRRLRLEAPDTRDKVEMFYRQELPRSGWLLQYDSSEHGAPSLSLYYIWADPSGSSPWHLQLNMSIHSRPEGKAEVRVDYNRIPNVENTPVYADAQELEVHHEEKPRDPELGGYHVRITTKTFVTRASQQEITDYYNSTLTEYGWFFMDKSGATTPHSQTGSLDGEGLYFAARARGKIPAETSIGIDLYITARPDADGRIRVQLIATETEVAGFK